ncbi:MAG: pyruvate synthase [Nitrospinae bacterium]|nr:pyruvate synthase [Nitrospinota bacterium]
MGSVTETKEIQPGVENTTQTVDFKSGNEMSSLAAAQVNFHVMGYYPITPSTEVAEYLDEMAANGEAHVHLVPGDGEHGAAGICYGATTAGGRVFNATSANGLLFSLEQLPVQSGTRYPMVLNLVCRSVSGPLDIRGDHSDLVSTLDMGWIVLLAKDPQAVYDMTIVAVRIGEHADVRLPVIVADDGFFTSHQKRRVEYFEDENVVRQFVGPFTPQNCSVDPAKPITIGPYMNDPDQINNKKQLSMAMAAAESVIPKVFAEWGKISGRKYNVLETYRMEDAETAIFILNSAADTAMDVADDLRKKGQKVGVIYPTMIRPFPAELLRQACKNVKAILVADRADSYGAHGGRMSHEVKAALKDDPENKTLVISRIYGLGGKDFFAEDAREMFRVAQDAAKKGRVDIPYDYIGAEPGDPNWKPVAGVPALTKEQQSPGILSVYKDEKTGLMEVKGVKQRDLTAMPHRIVPGHGACPGCGIFPNIGTFLKGIEGFVVMLWHTGCGMVVTTGYPNTSFAVTYIHNLFQNGAATLSGVVEMYKERQRRGEIPKEQDITFIMVTGDGGLDIGLGPALGTAFRNHNLIVLEYDNQGYMNTGAQLSFTTPIGHSTSTSNIGTVGRGKTFGHKDTAQLFAACHIPYVFTATESMYKDLIRKAAKAQYYAKHEGMVFGKLFSDCPLNWRHADNTGQEVVQAAVDCNFFPLYEVEHGITTLNYDPEAKGKKVPVTDWLKLMGKTKHMLTPPYKEIVDGFQKEVDRRFARIKAMSENPLL